MWVKTNSKSYKFGFKYKKFWKFWNVPEVLTGFYKTFYM